MSELVFSYISFKGDIDDKLEVEKTVSLIRDGNR